MKMLTNLKTFLLIVSVLSCTTTFAQNLTTPPNGGNKKATVSEKIGITDVTIHYDRPGVKGREGKIYGTDIAHYGFKDLGFGTSKAAPWRAGANENTTISFSTAVKVEGKDLAAGTYGFFLALEEGSATVIFSKNATSWGSYYYDPSEDALRVTVKTMKLNESVERLKYEFTDQTDNSAVIAMSWEKLKVPFKVEVDLVKIQIAVFKDELRGDKGFNWRSFYQAGTFALQQGATEQALEWSESAISALYIGEKNFSTLSLKAQVLDKMGKTAEADALMKEAMPMGTMQELHQYGRQLLMQKRNKVALEVFQLNAKKNPNVFTTNMGLMRAYAANGDYKNALKYANLAKPQAPDSNNKAAIEGMIEKLKAGQDIN
jgi:hypothetical protein